MANRLGELRHEEFSHCSVHERVGREKFRRTLLYSFSRTIIVKFFEKGGEQIENVKETAKIVQKSNFLLSFCFVSRFVGDETEVKEPQNVTNDTV